MANNENRGRRKALLAAGVASLAVLGLLPSAAQAANFPRLEKALAEMKEAKKFLQNAKNMFGGHKKKAIDALTTAIAEIEEAIKFASKG
jgi:septal ring factor EnvC (AmiA/AmiB activator)